MNCSGRLSASTSAASGAHRGPASRAVRPPKASTPHAPSSGDTAAAAVTPPTQKAADSTIGRPDMNCGTTLLPTSKYAKLWNESAPVWLPKAARSCGIGSEPWPEIQLAYWT